MVLNVFWCSAKGRAVAHAYSSREAAFMSAVKVTRVLNWLIVFTEQLSVADLPTILKTPQRIIKRSDYV